MPLNSNAQTTSHPFHAVIKILFTGDFGISLTFVRFLLLCRV